LGLLFALSAAFLTSFLPIVNKRLLTDTPVSVVAWGVTVLSLPLLGLLAVILLPFPHVGSIFWLGIVSSALLNLAATLISTQALKLADASLVTPVLTFNPAFTMLIAIFTLGEVPSLFGVLGVLVILAGGYVLNLEQIKGGWWRPLTALVTQRAMLLAVVASLVWGLTPIFEKLAIQHSLPANPPIVAFGSTALMAVFLTPLMLRQTKYPIRYLRTHRRGFLLAATIGGIAPVFGFSAIGLGLVGYVAAIFKLSTVFSVVLATLLLHEGAAKERLIASGLMVVGAVLIGF
jgi:drug/metabolite transporter (DMT)-like permease